MSDPFSTMGIVFLDREEVKQALDRIRVLNVPEGAIRPYALDAAQRYLALLDRRGLMGFTRILERRMVLS